MKVETDLMRVSKQTVSDKNTLFTLQNANGITVKVLTYGGIITSVSAPDKNGEFKNIVLGYDDPEVYLSEGYVRNCPYFGAIIGRFANRIARGTFKINGKTYHVAKNNGNNHLHGGIKGFDKVFWKAKEVSGDEFSGIELHYLSPDMEEGYPGSLNTIVTYRLTNSDELITCYEAETEKPTPLNLTNHTYFNLSAGKVNVLDHKLYLNAEKYTVFDKDNIPTGEIKEVYGTDLDFTVSRKVGAGKLPKRYDHNFVLNNTTGDLSMAAELCDPDSGRKLEVKTTYPGVQLYTADFTGRHIPANGSNAFEKFCGICFETQYFPDSPNQIKFPGTVLYPGMRYQHTTVFKFSVV